MNFVIRTTVSNTTKENVLKSFDSSMFLKLAPPFPKLELVRFDGCETNNEIHLTLNFIFLKKTWISLVTEHGSKNNQLYFIDEGTTLPPPLKYWKHYHGIHQVGSNVVIEDNVTYQSGNKLLDILLYPFFSLLFIYRKPIYKKYLKGLNDMSSSPLTIKNLPIPETLMELIKKGIWPKSNDIAASQNSTSIIKFENLKKFAPQENRIYFYSPPFKTVQDELSTMADYWQVYGALDQIDPKLAVVIGDFGIGSDTCIILDYRENLNKPKVLRLVWSDNNYWEKVADSFDEFCVISGLSNN